MKKAAVQLALTLSFVQLSWANIYYVSGTGSDISGDGTTYKPWKTLTHAVAKVAANHGHTIQIGAGTFVENGLVEVPLGVSIVGAGVDVTVLKAVSSFHYHPADPGYSTDKFLISLSGINASDGNQTLRDFTIDGDSKQLHGGIYVRYRNNVNIDEVKVQNTNYAGIWLWDVKDCQISNTQLINCSWGNTGDSSGALNLGNLERVEISNLNIDENTGYGIKALGPDGYNDIFYLKIHDCQVSVAPFGLWNNGTAPNIAIELWQSTLIGCEIYNSNVDNTISLVNGAVPPSGIQTIRVHHNTLDIDTRAHGAGYGIELSIHDAEVDHNYFLKGNYGIVNWDNPMQNWNIHHNTFYALQETTIGDVIRSQWSGLHGVKFYNNTIEFTGTQTMNVIGVYGGTSENIDIKNNLVINSNTGYNNYPNELIHTQNGALVSTNSLQVLSNSTANLEPGDLLDSILGLPLVNPLINLTNLANPSVTKGGNRPTPYYVPAVGSSLIDAGRDVGFPYAGAAPDIGAFEAGSIQVEDSAPLVSILYPPADATYFTSSSIAIGVSASDPDGIVAKVEFFNDSTKLGESTTPPYDFVWNNPPEGNASLTARAIDDKNATTSSKAVPITITLDTLIISIKPKEDVPISVYPNPAKTQLNIACVSEEVQQGQVIVYDFSSKIIRYAMVTINIGQNEIPIDIHDLSNGIYIVSFTTDKQKCLKRLVIQH